MLSVNVAYVGVPRLSSEVDGCFLKLVLCSWSSETLTSLILLDFPSARVFLLDVFSSVATPTPQKFIV